MFDHYLRSDSRDKARRASRREAKLRYDNPRYSGKRGNPEPYKWGGRVRVSNDPECEYLNEFGGFHSNKVIHSHWDSWGKEDGFFSYDYVWRWLQKQVGRRWDDVWSDICRRYDNRSYVGRETRSLFFNPRWRYSNKVQTDVYYSVDGNVRNVRDFGVVLHDELYVEPDTGILRHGSGEKYWGAAARRRRAKTNTSDEIAKLGNEFFYHVGKCDRRQYTHLYTYEEVGKSPRNRTKAWFVTWNEDCGTEKVWNPVSYLTAQYSEETLRRCGYIYNPNHWGSTKWGKWRVRPVIKTYKRSCNRKEIQAIHAFIRKHKEENREEGAMA